MNQTRHDRSAPAPDTASLPGVKRRIFVVEDHAFMRQNLVATLEREPTFTVCGEADDATVALSGITAAQPDLVLTDLKLKTSSGLDLVRALRSHAPSLPVLVTTMFDVPANERRARDAGASGFVSKQDGPEALIAAVRAALPANASPAA